MRLVNPRRTAKRIIGYMGILLAILLFNSKPFL